MFEFGKKRVLSAKAYVGKYQHRFRLSCFNLFVYSCFFSTSENTKTRGFEFKNLALDPAFPNISILDPHCQLLMFVCDFYSYRELV